MPSQTTSYTARMAQATKTLPYLTPAEFAERLGLTAGTVSRQMRAGVIPYVTTEGGGGKWIPVEWVAIYQGGHRAEGRSVAMRERRNREVGSDPARP